jgi:Cytochrome P460
VYNFTHAQGTYTEGGRTLLAVMVKDATRDAVTGRWGFQAWAGDLTEPLVTDAARQCYQC